jgi:AAA family ATP:ADP antiporter
VHSIAPASASAHRASRSPRNVKPDEWLLTALMLLCVFLILTAYYILKTAREGLILGGGSFGLRGDELKTYATGAMALLLIGIVPAYGVLADKQRRIRLINIFYAVVILSLAGFFALGQAGVSIGLGFFIWLGVVSVFLVAQFWSYANDLYSEEQGVRLFAIIATGGSLGAIVGPRIAVLADTFSLMWIAALILCGCVLLLNMIEHAVHVRGHDERGRQPIGGPGGFALVLHDRYLLMIACLLLVTSVVNTTGEFVLSNIVRDRAFELVPATAHADLFGAAREAAIEGDRRELIKAFYSDFFVWVNGLSFIIQALLVSRVLRRLGVRYALFVLPVIAFGAYSLIAVIGGFALVRAAKIGENATDYSLQNTVRQTLFLPTDRAVKYKAKATIDTFFVRLGDTLSAILVGVGIHQFGFGGRALAVVNLFLIAGWVALVVGITHRHRVISAVPSAPKLSIATRLKPQRQPSHAAGISLSTRWRRVRENAVRSGDAADRHLGP